jgi:hypothetical protein
VVCQQSLLSIKIAYNTNNNWNQRNMRGKFLGGSSLVLIISLLIILFTQGVHAQLSNIINIQSSGMISYESADSLPRLKVVGNEIQFTNGSQVWLKGVNYVMNYWLWKLGGCPGGVGQYEYMADWGINCVRLIAYPAIDFSSYASDLDNQIEWAAQNGIYTLLNCHLGGIGHVDSWDEGDWADWVAWWEVVATRYSGNTNVLYDLLNEPQGLSASEHQTRWRTCIDAIRAIDPNVIIVIEAIGENDWYDIGLMFEQTHPIQRSNIVFSPHHYYGDNAAGTSKSSIRNTLSNVGAEWCLNNNRAVMIGEVAYDVDLCPVNGAAWLANWLAVMDEDGYCGFQYWWWSTSEWTRLLVNWNGSPNAAGSILQEYLTS